MRQRLVIIRFLLFFVFFTASAFAVGDLAFCTKDFLRRYYCDGGYEERVSELLKGAKKYFSKLLVKKNSLIVLDIDDTSLMTYPMYAGFDSLCLGSKRNGRLKFLAQKGTAISATLDFYNFVISRGFKVAFVTARDTDFMAVTFAQLLNAGFNKFEHIFLKPKFVLNQALWKFQQRQFLSKYYDIVGCIGDKESDCAYGFFGEYRLILPNCILKLSGFKSGK